MAWHGASMK